MPVAKKWTAQITKAGDKMPNPLSPTLQLLMKLGSIIVHTDEAFSVKGRRLDIEVMKPLLADPEVQQWIKDMGVYLPLKR